MVKFKTACTLCTFEYSVSFCSHLHFTSPTPRRWRVLKFLFTFKLRLERLFITCCFSNLLLWKFIPISFTEWGSTARNLIARQSFARHFWQEINCSILFTINCVEQLTFSKTFVEQLQFEQLIFFWLKVKLLESS